MRDNLIFASICCIKQCFKNIDVKNITEHKKFWKTIRLFSNKCKTAKSIIFIENGKTLHGDKVIANFRTLGLTKQEGPAEKGGHASPTFC